MNCSRIAVIVCCVPGATLEIIVIVLCAWSQWCYTKSNCCCVLCVPGATLKTVIIVCCVPGTTQS